MFYCVISFKGLERMNMYVTVLSPAGNDAVTKPTIGHLILQKRR